MEDLNSDHSADLCENSDSWLPWGNEVPRITGTITFFYSVCFSITKNFFV